MWEWAPVLGSGTRPSSLTSALRWFGAELPGAGVQTIGLFPRPGGRWPRLSVGGHLRTFSLFHGRPASPWRCCLGSLCWALLHSSGPGWGQGCVRLIALSCGQGHVGSVALSPWTGMREARGLVPMDRDVWGLWLCPRGQGCVGLVALSPWTGTHGVCGLVPMDRDAWGSWPCHRGASRCPQPSAIGTMLCPLWGPGGLPGFLPPFLCVAHCSGAKCGRGGFHRKVLDTVRPLYEAEPVCCWSLCRTARSPPISTCCLQEHGDLDRQESVSTPARVHSPPHSGCQAGQVGLEQVERPERGQDEGTLGCPTGKGP